MKSPITVMKIVFIASAFLLLHACATVPIAGKTTMKEFQITATTRTDASTTTSNTLAIKRRAVKESQSDAVLQPIKTNRSFELNPIKESKLIRQGQSHLPTAKVRVVGTYSPKGIYRQPANYSTMLMRAAPGTLFELEYLANDWYKIVTENGIGYLREDDGKIETTTVQQ